MRPPGLRSKMGANTFHEVAKRLGKQDGHTETLQGIHRYLTPKFTTWTAQEAFESLCNDDRYENGHSYSGGIGMKDNFVHIATVDTVEEAHTLSEKLIDDCDDRVSDKWGPAGCITIKTGDYAYLFFGWASS
jgi:hypothetical protein